jgi:hypothetical protein
MINPVAAPTRHIIKISTDTVADLLFEILKK